MGGSEQADETGEDPFLLRRLTRTSLASERPQQTVMAPGSVSPAKAPASGLGDGRPRIAKADENTETQIALLTGGGTQLNNWGSRPN